MKAINYRILAIPLMVVAINTLAISESSAFLEKFAGYVKEKGQQIVKNPAIIPVLPVVILGDIIAPGNNKLTYSLPRAKAVYASNGQDLSKKIILEIDWTTKIPRPTDNIVNHIKKAMLSKGYVVDVILSQELADRELVDGETDSIQSFLDASGYETERNFDFELHPNAHYCVLMEKFGQSKKGAGGTGDISGRYMAIPAGRFTSSDISWYEKVVSAAIIHELGHNLSLEHGGYEKKNGKPNYTSCMNYDYSYYSVDDPDLRFKLESGDIRRFYTQSDWPFSEGKHLPLNENNLDESKGIGDIAGRLIAIDWNGNALYNDRNVALDIDNDDTKDKKDTTLSILSDNDDWAQIAKYKHRHSMALAFNAHGNSDDGPTVEATDCDVIPFFEFLDRNMTPEAKAVWDSYSDPEVAYDGLDFTRQSAIYNNTVNPIEIVDLYLDIPTAGISILPGTPFTIPPGGRQVFDVIVDWDAVPVGVTNRRIIMLDKNGNEVEGPEITVDNYKDVDLLYASPSSLSAVVGNSDGNIESAGVAAWWYTLSKSRYDSVKPIFTAQTNMSWAVAEVVPSLDAFLPGANIKLHYDTQGLPVGVNSGILTVSCDQASNAVQIPFSLTVLPEIEEGTCPVGAFEPQLIEPRKAEATWYRGRKAPVLWRNFSCKNVTIELWKGDSKIRTLKKTKNQWWGAAVKIPKSLEPGSGYSVRIYNKCNMESAISCTDISIE